MAWGGGALDTVRETPSGRCIGHRDVMLLGVVVEHDDLAGGAEAQGASPRGDGVGAVRAAPSGALGQAAQVLALGRLRCARAHRQHDR